MFAGWSGTDPNVSTAGAGRPGPHPLAALAPLHGSAPHRSALHGARASLGLPVGAALPNARWEGTKGQRFTAKPLLRRPHKAEAKSAAANARRAGVAIRGPYADGGAAPRPTAKHPAGT